MRHAPVEAGHADRAERRLHAPVDLVGREPHVERAERDVVEHGGAEQLVVGVLEHEAHLGPDAPDRVLAHGHPRHVHAPVRGPERPVELEHERALAGAVRSDEGHLLARADAQVDAAEGLEPVGIAEVDVVELDRAARVWATVRVGRGRGPVVVHVGVRVRRRGARVDVLVRVEVRGIGCSVTGVGATGTR